MTYIPEKLREQVQTKADWRCEYCLLHQDFAYYTHEIDHIYAEKHGGKTEVNNLCLACADCNRHKGSNLCSLDPHTGEIVSLYHPRTMLWQTHFRMKDSGIVEALTSQARATIKVLRFNRLELVVDRERLIKLGKY